MIRGFIETSFVDWPGRSCAVIFTGGCNLRCPFCHNHPLVLAPEDFPPLDPDEIIARIMTVGKWLGGICVTGGEPTLHQGLPDLLIRLAETGLPIKLDSNGTRPEVLARIIDQDLVEMIDMDVKAPLEQKRYRAAVGVDIDLDLIRRSINLIATSGLAHRFRMTVLPNLHQESDIMAWHRELPQGSARKLQNFRPGQTLDPALAAATVFTDQEFAELEKILLP